MFDDLRSKLLGQVSRVVLGAILVLASGSLAGAYVARCDLETKSREHSHRQHEASQRLTFFRSLLEEASAAVNDSRHRLMRAGLLGSSLGPSVVHRATADRRQDKASLESRDAAAADLASLAKFSDGSSHAGQTLLRHVEEMLNAEIQIWSKIDSFAEQKGAKESDDDEAFYSAGQALREYRELETSYASAVLRVGGELPRQAIEENAETKLSVERALRSSRSWLHWSGLGLATATLGLPCYAFYICRPRRSRRSSAKQ